MTCLPLYPPHVSIDVEDRGAAVDVGRPRAHTAAHVDSGPAIFYVDGQLRRTAANTSSGKGGGCKIAASCHVSASMSAAQDLATSEDDPANRASRTRRKQINLVAISSAPAAQLVAILLGASAQPAERPMAAGERLPSWRRALGMNQLDDRSVEPYDREPSSPSRSSET